MSDITGIIVTILLLAANFYFVGAEFALISARRSIIEPKAERGSRSAKMTLWAIENVSLVMAGAQLGITVCSLALGYVTKPLVKYAVEGPFESIGIPSSWIDPLSYAIALMLVTYLHVVLAEMVPKNMALAGPERMAMILGPSMVILVKVLRPVLWTMNAMGNLVLRAMGVTPKNEVASTFTRNEVANMVAESREGGLLDRQDERLLLGALSFDARTIGSVAIDFATVKTLPANATAAMVEDAAAQGFSRFPLTDAAGTPVGYVHIKDILGHNGTARMLPLEQAVIRTLPEFTSEQSVRPALQSMQRSGAHLALVRDAGTGQITGLVTLEDLLEELVGQIRHDAA
ncbi:hemolysin family protein [Glutamicibacter sp.]|uniref:hemolysin family protein n=1 Tax=Glutamicibacter sp. TaxID=1931995 RepID=UPI002B464077|nr:hemolysin family protein [Glutamicibacter sp.]HJX80187.1 hemolysin family protein [Glutamicibacter sp.]